MPAGCGVKFSVTAAALALVDLVPKPARAARYILGCVPTRAPPGAVRRVSRVELRPSIDVDDAANGVAEGGGVPAGRRALPRRCLFAPRETKELGPHPHTSVLLMSQFALFAHPLPPVDSYSAFSAT